MESTPATTEQPSTASMEQMFQKILLEIADMRKDLAKITEQAVHDKQVVVDLKGGVAEVKEDVKQISEHVTRLDMERMMLFLRFQNLQETPGEDLRDIMGTMLADFTQRTKEFILGEMDLVYRINSAYARTHDVPREVHVKFVKRSTRDLILRMQGTGPLKYLQQDVAILKQIPKKIRETRRKYSFLSQKLFTKGVWFKWLYPEGLVVFWEGSRVNLKTVADAQDFLVKHAALLEVDTGGGGEGPASPPVTGAEGGTPIAKRTRGEKKKRT